MDTWMEMDQDDGFVDRDLTSSLIGAESFGSAHKNYQNALIRKKQTESEEESGVEGSETDAFSGTPGGRMQRKVEATANSNEYTNFGYGKYAASGQRSYDTLDSSENNFQGDTYRLKSSGKNGDLRKFRSQRYNDPVAVFRENFDDDDADDAETRDKCSLCEPHGGIDAKSEALEEVGDSDEYLFGGDDRLSRDLDEFDLKDFEVGQSEARRPTADEEDERSFDDSEYYSEYKGPTYAREGSPDLDYSQINPHGIVYKREEIKPQMPNSKSADEGEETSQGLLNNGKNIKTVKDTRNQIILQAESPKESRQIVRTGVKGVRRNTDMVWKVNGKLQTKELNDVMRDSQRALEEVQMFQHKLASKPQYNYLNPDWKRNTPGAMKQSLYDETRGKREDEDEQKNMKTGTDEGGGEYEDEEGKGHNDEEEYYEEAEFSAGRNSDSLKQKFHKRNAGKDARRKELKKEGKGDPSSEDFELNMENAPVENEEKLKKTSFRQGKKTLNRKGAKIWDRWSEWSQCSVTCGIGRSIRWRHCIGGGCAQGEKEAQIKKCTKPAC